MTGWNSGKKLIKNRQSATEKTIKKKKVRKSTKFSHGIKL